MTDIKKLTEDLEYTRYHCISTKGKDAINNALDLINRQQAEIERLQKVNDSFTDIGKMYSEIKAEAIKEFAERLKNIYIKDKRYDRPNAHTLIDWLFANIDNLVKEMVGDTE
jgi:hypothetical protein